MTLCGLKSEFERSSKLKFLRFHQISDFRFQISDFRFQILRSQISDLRSQILRFSDSQILKIQEEEGSCIKEEQCLRKSWSLYLITNSIDVLSDTMAINEFVV